MTRKMRFVISMAVLVAGVLTAVPARAQGAGVRAGVSGGPGQFYFGGHDEFGPVADQFWFRPNVEIGLGDHQTVVAVNFEFAYRLLLPQTDWHLYLGAGPALNIVRVAGNTDPKGGLNILVGAQHRGGLFTELKIGLVDSPEVKFGVGYTFH